MIDQEKNWTTFWEHQRNSFDEVMRVSTAYFARRFVKFFRVGADDDILDYGCGPGFLADALEATKANISGADINTSFLEQCRKNHPADLFIHITTDAEANKKILDQQLGKKKFNYVVLLSITQYFQNIEELDKVVGLLQGYLKENGKIILADVVDDNTSSPRDLASIFFHCVRAGRTIAFIRFILYLLFSNYRSLSRHIKLLQISQQSMIRVANNNHMDCEKMDHLTLHPSRNNYVLTGRI